MPLFGLVVRTAVEAASVLLAALLSGALLALLLAPWLTHRARPQGAVPEDAASPADALEHRWTRPRRTPILLGLLALPLAALLFGFLHAGIGWIAVALGAPTPQPPVDPITGGLQTLITSQLIAIASPLVGLALYGGMVFTVGILADRVVEAVEA